MGTPASLKEAEGDAMRLELILEPGKNGLDLPEWLLQPVTVNRRVVGWVNPSDISTAIAWARGLKDNGTIEEFSLGPATLEDVYIRLVKNPDEPEQNKKKA
jgi:ABC-2 type transport system ATP-binding protein